MLGRDDWTVGIIYPNNSSNNDFQNKVEYDMI